MLVNLQDAFLQIADIGAAATTLGASSSALVDATKSFDGGVSNVGFSYIKYAITPFEDALNATNPRQGIETIRANWLSGMATADQLTAAQSLISLGLTTTTAPKVAKTLANLDANEFVAAVTATSNGQALTDLQKTVMKTFDDTVTARLNAAIQRADKQYECAAKLAASALAIVLAVLGVTVVAGGHPGSDDLLLGVVAGVLATPVAPVAKDLFTVLSTLATTLKGSGATAKV